MEQVEDSFDGTFGDNIRSPAYKATHNPKKNKIVINVGGNYPERQIPSMQWSSTWPRRTSGSCRRSPPTT